MNMGHLKRLVAIAAIAIATAGCASTKYASLVNQRDVPDLATALEATNEHPNHTVMVPTRGPEGEPEVHIAIHKIESPGDRKLLVMIHGVFSNSSAWRFMVGDLAKDFDLWLIDLPGCGLSDKPAPEQMGPNGYSPPALGHRVLEALQTELAKRADDKPIGIVAHSLGGTVTLRMFGDPALRERFSAVTSRTDRLMLLSPFDVAINKMDPTFAQVAEANGLLIDAGAAIGYIQDRVAEGTLASVIDPKRALREEADLRISILTTPETRAAAQAMIRQATSWKGRRPDWQVNLAATALYRNVKVPTLIIWGEQDEILPCAMGFKIAAQMHQADLVCVPEVMHSPELERPTLICRLIREFDATGKPPELDPHAGMTHH